MVLYAAATCCTVCCVFRYHEGAVHPVVLQLLHDEKIPPTDLPARMDKLMVTVTLMGKHTNYGRWQLINMGQDLAWSDPALVRPVVGGQACSCSVCSHISVLHSAVRCVVFDLAEAPTDGSQSAVEAPRSLVRRMTPGSAYLSELSCQRVTPGRKYWLQATMVCKVRHMCVCTTRDTTQSLIAGGQSRGFEWLHIT